LRREQEWKETKEQKHQLFFTERRRSEFPQSLSSRDGETYFKKNAEAQSFLFLASICTAFSLATR
jgi:hypothetical protein